MNLRYQLIEVIPSPSGEGQYDSDYNTILLINNLSQRNILPKLEQVCGTTTGQTQLISRYSPPPSLLLPHVRAGQTPDKKIPDHF